MPQLCLNQRKRGTDLSGSLEGAGGIGGLLGLSQGYSGGNWSTHYCYHADGNGNITYLVNSSQTVAASYRYDAYGNTLSSSGSLAGANTYRFSSKMADDLSGGLYYYGYRWYAPNLQRWVTRDPLGEPGFEVLIGQDAVLMGDGSNLYAFVRNSPTDSIDFLGLIGGGPPYEGKPCCLKMSEENWKRQGFKSLSDCIDAWKKPYSPPWWLTGGAACSTAVGWFGSAYLKPTWGRAGIPGAFLTGYNSGLIGQGVIDCTKRDCLQWGKMSRTWVPTPGRPTRVPVPQGYWKWECK